MKPTYRLSSAAAADLDAIHHRIGQRRGWSDAHRIIADLRIAMRRVSLDPNIGDVRWPGAHRFRRVGRYTVIYDAQRDPVLILRVVKED